MAFRPGACVLIFAALAGACQPAPRSDQPAFSERTSPTTKPDAASESQPVAYVDGRPVRRDAMFRPLVEAAGGRVLTELVLERVIEDRLEASGMTLNDADIRRERQRIGLTLDAENEDQAARLLRELRRQRGLGEARFEGLLRRNAGLRKLVADQVEVTEQSLRQAYERRYGIRYRARVLTVSRFDKASRLRRQLATGEARFADLAARHSTDASADRGGLLAPISPADPNYPESIRNALRRLAEGGASGTQPNATRLSEVIALDDGFALLRLEEKIEPEPVEFADVKGELQRSVRLALEQRLMRQLARRLLSEADVVVLNPALGESWRNEQDVLLSPR